DSRHCLRLEGVSLAVPLHGAGPLAHPARSGPPRIERTWLTALRYPGQSCQRNGFLRAPLLVQLVEAAIRWREVRPRPQELGGLTEPTARIDQGGCLDLAHELSGQTSPR